MARQRCHHKDGLDDHRAIIPDFYPVIPNFYPVIPAKAGIQKAADALSGNADKTSSALALSRNWRGARLVRIRIRGIIGFQDFSGASFARRALARIRLGGIFGYGERRKPGDAKS